MIVRHRGLPPDLPELDQPRSVRPRAGEVHRQLGRDPHLGRQRRGGVDDQQVAGEQQAGQVGEAVLADLAGRPAADQHPDPVPGQAARLGRVVRLQRGGQGELVQCGQRGHELTGSRGIRCAARYRPLGSRCVTSRTNAGTTDGGLGPVRDVLAGEGQLVHVGAQVAGIGPPDPQRRLLGGQHVRGLLQGGLGRAVAAPARVGLHRRVRGDVQHRAAAGAQQRQHQLGQRDRRDHVHLERGAQLVRRVVGQRGQRAGAQRAGVVDEQVEPARGARRGEQGGPVRRVGDVAGNRGDGAGTAWPLRGGPAARSAPATASSAAASRASMMRSKPSRARPAARARPSPREAPVIMAVRIVHIRHARHRRARAHRPAAPPGLRR